MPSESWNGVCVGFCAELLTWRGRVGCSWRRTPVVGGVVAGWGESRPTVVVGGRRWRGGVRIGRRWLGVGSSGRLWWCRERLSHQRWRSGRSFTFLVILTSITGNVRIQLGNVTPWQSGWRLRDGFFVLLNPQRTTLVIPVQRGPLRTFPVTPLHDPPHSL